MHKIIMKIVSLVLVSIFTVETVFAQVPRVSGEQVQPAYVYYSQIAIPQEYGTVGDTWLEGKEGIVYLIEDAHTSLVTQKNIARIISDIVEGRREKIEGRKKQKERDGTTSHLPSPVYPLSSHFILCTEGYEGDLGKRIDDAFSGVSDPVSREKTAEFLMKNGEMTGAQYAHLKEGAQLPLYGVEYEKTYLDNLAQFKEVLKQWQTIEPIIKDYRQKTVDVKKKCYPLQILKLDEEEEQFRTNKDNTYIAELLSCATKAHCSLDAYPVLAGLSAHPEVKISTLDSSRLLEECNALFRAIKRKTLQGDAKILSEFEESLMLLEKLFTATLTREEWESHFIKQKEFCERFYAAEEWLMDQNGYGAGCTVQGAEILRFDRKTFETALKNARSFYRAVRIRDKYMAKNTYRQMKWNKTDHAILVVGGFHTNGVKRYLKEYGVSYVVIRPCVGIIDTRLSEIYFQKALGVEVAPVQYMVNLLARSITATNVFTKMGNNTVSYRDFVELISAFVRRDIKRINIMAEQHKDSISISCDEYQKGSSGEQWTMSVYDRKECRGVDFTLDSDGEVHYERVAMPRRRFRREESYDDHVGWSDATRQMDYRYELAYRLTSHSQVSLYAVENMAFAIKRFIRKYGKVTNATHAGLFGDYAAIEKQITDFISEINNMEAIKYGLYERKFDDLQKRKEFLPALATRLEELYAKHKRFESSGDQDIVGLLTYTKQLSEYLSWMNRFAMKDIKDEVTDVRTLIQQSDEELHRSENKSSTVDINAIPMELKIKGDSRSLKNAFLQFLENAYQRKSVPVIETQKLNSGDLEMRIRTPYSLLKATQEETDATKAEFLTLCQPTDNPEKQRLFELGVKGNDGGTGLGMALAWEIFKDHGITVRADLDQDKTGVVFAITVPKERVVRNKAASSFSISRINRRAIPFALLSKKMKYIEAHVHDQALRQFMLTFVQYSAQNILSAQGDQLLAAALSGSLTKDQKQEIITINQFFASVPHLSRDQIFAHYPAQYFRRISFPSSISETIVPTFVDGCTNCCGPCPVQHTIGPINSMPYPMVIQLAMAESTNIFIDIAPYNYEPFLYRDAAGILFYDVHRLFETRRHQSEAHTIITHGIAGDDPTGLFEANAQRLNISGDRYRIFVSVHVDDSDYYRLKKEGKNEREIVDYYVSRYEKQISLLQTHAVIIHERNMPEEYRDADYINKMTHEVVRRLSELFKDEPSVEIPNYYGRDTTILSRRAFKRAREDVEWRTLLKKAARPRKFRATAIIYALDSYGNINISYSPRYVTIPKDVYDQLDEKEKDEILRAVQYDAWYLRSIHVKCTIEHEYVPPVLQNFADQDLSDRYDWELDNIVQEIVNQGWPVPVPDSVISSIRFPKTVPQFRSLGLSNVWGNYPQHANGAWRYVPHESTAKSKVADHSVVTDMIPEKQVVPKLQDESTMASHSALYVGTARDIADEEMDELFNDIMTEQRLIRKLVWNTEFQRITEGYGGKAYCRIGDKHYVRQDAYSLSTIMMSGPPNVIRIGSLFIMEPEFYRALSLSLQKRVGTNVLLLPDIKADEISRITHNNYNTSCIFDMIDKEVGRYAALDIGAGNGILSLVALKLGSPTVDLFECEPKQVESAVHMLKCNGYIHGKDFFIHEGDLTDETFMMHAVRAIHERLQKTNLEAVLISNIGTWPHYTANNRIGLPLLMRMPEIRLFMTAGNKIGEENNGIVESDQRALKYLAPHFTVTDRPVYLAETSIRLCWSAVNTRERGYRASAQAPAVDAVVTKEIVHRFQQIFSEYKTRGILSGKGNMLLEKARTQTLSALQKIEVLELVEYFNAISKMSKKEIIQRFPSPYFLHVTIPEEFPFSFTIRLVEDDSAENSLHGEESTYGHMTTMPYPVLVMLAMKSNAQGKIEINPFADTAVRYHDVCGATYEDAQKLLGEHNAPTVKTSLTKSISFVLSPEGYIGAEVSSSYHVLSRGEYELLDAQEKQRMYDFVRDDDRYWEFIQYLGACLRIDASYGEKIASRKKSYSEQWFTMMFDFIVDHRWPVPVSSIMAASGKADTRGPHITRTPLVRVYAEENTRTAEETGRSISELFYKGRRITNITPDEEVFYTADLADSLPVSELSGYEEPEPRGMMPPKTIPFGKLSVAPVAMWVGGVLTQHECVALMGLALTIGMAVYAVIRMMPGAVALLEELSTHNLTNVITKSRMLYVFDRASYDPQEGKKMVPLYYVKAEELSREEQRAVFDQMIEWDNSHFTGSLAGALYESLHSQNEQMRKRLCAFRLVMDEKKRFYGWSKSYELPHSEEVIIEEITIKYSQVYRGIETELLAATIEERCGVASIKKVILQDMSQFVYEALSRMFPSVMIPQPYHDEVDFTIHAVSRGDLNLKTLLQKIHAQRDQNIKCYGISSIEDFDVLGKKTTISRAKQLFKEKRRIKNLLAKSLKDIETRDLPSNLMRFAKIFIQYKIQGIVSERGNALLERVLAGTHTKEDVTSIRSILSFFDAIPELSADEICERYPAEYFREIEIPEEVESVKILLNDGCNNMCTVCPVQKEYSMLSMPYPLVIQIARRIRTHNPYAFRLGIEIDRFNYEPLLYRDAAGILFHDVQKLFSAERGIITHGAIAGEAEKVYYENVARLNASGEHYEIDVSVHVNDLDLVRLKKKNASYEDIVNYFVDRFYRHICALRGYKIELRKYYLPSYSRGASDINALTDAVVKGLCNKLDTEGVSYEPPDYRMTQEIISKKAFHRHGNAALAPDIYSDAVSERNGHFAADLFYYSVNAYGQLVVTSTAYSVVLNEEVYSQLPQNVRDDIVSAVRHNNDYWQMISLLCKKSREFLPPLLQRYADGVFKCDLDWVYNDLLRAIVAEGWPIPVTDSLIRSEAFSKRAPNYEHLYVPVYKEEPQVRGSNEHNDFLQSRHDNSALWSGKKWYRPWGPLVETIIPALVSIAFGGGLIGGVAASAVFYLGHFIRVWEDSRSPDDEVRATKWRHFRKPSVLVGTALTFFVNAMFTDPFILSSFLVLLGTIHYQHYVVSEAQPEHMLAVRAEKSMKRSINLIRRGYAHEESTFFSSLKRLYLHWKPFGLFLGYIGVGSGVAYVLSSVSGQSLWGILFSLIAAFWFMKVGMPRMVAGWLSSTEYDLEMRRKELVAQTSQQDIAALLRLMQFERNKWDVLGTYPEVEVLQRGSASIENTLMLRKLNERVDAINALEEPIAFLREVGLLLQLCRQKEYADEWQTAIINSLHLKKAEVLKAWNRLLVLFCKAEGRATIAQLVLLQHIDRQFKGKLLSQDERDWLHNVEMHYVHIEPAERNRRFNALVRTLSDKLLSSESWVEWMFAKKGARDERGDHVRKPLGQEVLPRVTDIQQRLDEVVFEEDDIQTFRQCRIYSHPSLSFCVKELIDNHVLDGDRRGLYLKSFASRGWELGQERAGGLVLPFVIQDVYVHSATGERLLIKDAIVQEKAQHRDLTEVIEQLLQQKRVGEAIDYVRKFFETDAALMARGIFMCDPLLENAVVGSDGTVKILDCGMFVSETVASDHRVRGISHYFNNRFFNSLKDNGINSALVDELRLAYGECSGIYPHQFDDQYFAFFEPFIKNERYYEIGEIDEKRFSEFQKSNKEPRAVEWQEGAFHSIVFSCLQRVEIMPDTTALWSGKKWYRPWGPFVETVIPALVSVVCGGGLIGGVAAAAVFYFGHFIRVWEDSRSPDATVRTHKWKYLTNLSLLMLAFQTGIANGGDPTSSLAMVLRILVFLCHIFHNRHSDALSHLNATRAAMKDGTQDTDVPSSSLHSFLSLSDIRSVKEKDIMLQKERIAQFDNETTFMKKKSFNAKAFSNIGMILNVAGFCIVNDGLDSYLSQLLGVTKNVFSPEELIWTLVGCCIILLLHASYSFCIEDVWEYAREREKKEHQKKLLLRDPGPHSVHPYSGKAAAYQKPLRALMPSLEEGGITYKMDPPYDALSSQDTQDLDISSDIFHYATRAHTYFGIKRLFHLYTSLIQDSIAIHERQKVVQFLMSGSQAKLRIRLGSLLSTIEDKRAHDIVIEQTPFKKALSRSISSEGRGYLFSSKKTLSDLLDRTEEIARIVATYPEASDILYLKEIQDVLRAVYDNDAPYSLYDEVKDRSFAGFDRLVQTKRVEFERLLSALSELDAYLSIAQSAIDHELYRMPTVLAQNVPYVKITNGIHPLMVLRNDVQPNSFELRHDRDRMYVISGPNMAGKTTAEKMLALNLILAHMGSPVAVVDRNGKNGEMMFTPVKIRTHINVQDSLAEGRSTFDVETDLMKAIVDAACNEPNAFLMLVADEMLRGTINSWKVKTQIAVLRYLNKRGVLGVVSVHEPEVVQFAEHEAGFKNVHFREYIGEKGVVRPYCMFEGGITESDANVVAVLQRKGFPEEIIKDVMNMWRKSSDKTQQMQTILQSEGVSEDLIAAVLAEMKQKKEKRMTRLQDTFVASEFDFSEHDDRIVDIMVDYDVDLGTNEKLMMLLKTYMAGKNDGDYRISLLIPSTMKQNAGGIAELKRTFPDPDKLHVYVRHEDESFAGAVSMLVKHGRANDMEQDYYPIVVSDRKSELDQIRDTGSMRKVCVSGGAWYGVDKRLFIMLAFFEVEIDQNELKKNIDDIGLMSFLVTISSESLRLRKERILRVAA